MAPLEPSGLLPEEAADLRLGAARVALDAGRHADARSWVAALPIGDGPCAPPLAARQKLLLALSHAQDGGAGETFASAATEAAAAWRDLRDVRGRRDALGALVSAARTPGGDGRIPEIVAEHDELRRAGRPGGSGGSAHSGGNRSGAADLPWDAPLFALRASDGAIGIEDRVAGTTQDVPLAWVPSNLALNGLSLTIFLGYVVVRSLDYGGGSVAAGSPGTTTLDELGRYRPVPGHGVLIVQRNGAVRAAAR